MTPVLSIPVTGLVHLLCRIGLHSWESTTREISYEYEQVTEHCTRCATVRVRIESAWDQMSGI